MTNTRRTPNNHTKIIAEWEKLAEKYRDVPHLRQRFLNLITGLEASTSPIKGFTIHLHDQCPAQPPTKPTVHLPQQPTEQPPQRKISRMAEIHHHLSSYKLHE